MVWLLVGLGLGIVVGLMFAGKKCACCETLRGVCGGSNKDDDKTGIIKDQEEEKEKNLAKIREYLKVKEKVTNEEIQKLLGISDATVARYFNDLEKEGIIKQVGEVGKSVYYEINN